MLYILDLINTSLLQGIFPDVLKHSSITPIIKDINADCETLKNYRPISNTPTLAKIIEKPALAQVNYFLIVNSLHTPTQCGYK